MTIPLCSYYPMIMAFLQSALQTRVEISPREMLAISQAISREYAPRFAKADVECTSPITFSAQELLAISEEISREFSPRPVKNRASLVLLPVDPGRLHAYWNLAEQSFSAVSKPLGDAKKSDADEKTPIVEEHLTLRIFTQPNPSVKTTDKPMHSSWFDIPINSSQCHQDIQLPIGACITRSTYSAAIGIAHDEHDFIALAYSNTAAIPNPTFDPDKCGLSDSMAQLIMPYMKASSSIAKTASHQEMTES
ncbi:MAG: DUF4912 domain-containing protein [Methylomonas sp.]